jgi:hypothetical protein
MSGQVRSDSSVAELVCDLERDGVVRLPNLFSPEQIRAMQRAFDARLERMRWNNLDGFEKTEPNRHMVEDVLALEQAFVDGALNDTVKMVLRRYLGRFALVEARGWRSLPTRRDFHGWHGDEWYDQEVARDIPKEVKLGFFLTDVRSGAFNYIKGSHRKHAPRRIRTVDLPTCPPEQIVAVSGPAGTAFLFDTSGVHRQGVPLLEPRHVVFFNYHDPSVKLQEDDVKFYRYHPLLLNAAFLGDLSEEDHEILGFGDKTNYIPAFVRPSRSPRLHWMLTRVHEVNLRLDEVRERIATRLRRWTGGGRR